MTPHPDAPKPLTDEEIEDYAKWILEPIGVPPRHSPGRILATIRSDRVRLLKSALNETRMAQDLDEVKARAEAAEARVKDLESALQAAEEALDLGIKELDWCGPKHVGKNYDTMKAALQRIRGERGSG